MSDEFGVLACGGDCNQPWIQPVGWRGQDSVSCPNCGADHVPKKVKKLKRLPTREAAGEWRARYLAKRAGEAKGYNDFALDRGQYDEQGQLVEDRMPAVSSEALDLEIAGVDEQIEAHYATDASRSDRVTNPLEDTIVGHKKRFEALNEYRIKQFQEESQKFEALAEDVVGNAVSLDDQLQTYYGEPGDADRTLTDPEPTGVEADTPEFDIRSLSMQPTPPAQQHLDTITVTVPPTVSDWLPATLEDLLPQIVRAVTELVADFDGKIDASRLADLLVSEYGVSDVRSGFASVLATYACEYHGIDLDERNLSESAREYHEHNREWARAALTQIGAGRNALGVTHEDLVSTIVPVLRASDVTPEFVVRFDGQQWIESDHASTRRKTLTALEQLAMAGDVAIVTSPRVARTLDSSHPDFADRVTQINMPGRQPAESDAPVNVCDEGAIYAELELMDKRAGKLAILKHLDRDPGATVKDLANDADIYLSRGSIRPYIDSLESDHGFVTVDGRGVENTMSLTDRGEVAADLITDDHRVVHPDQETVFATFDQPEGNGSDDYPDSVTETPSQSASTVYGTDDGMCVGEDGCRPEAALADTGDAAEDGYVQWLPKLAGSSWPLHARITGADARDGVNLNDYPVERWEDGRVTYVSCMEDHLAVTTQYGGTIPTLVRLATALLDDKLWSTVLTPSALGDELENCFGETVDDTHDYLVRAAQVGWLSEDERAYDLFKDRYAGVRSVLLKKLGELGELDEDERTEVIRKAHGLLMSATALYDAIGVDISIEVRVPEPNNLNETQFCRFLSEVATRQSSYGMHSLERNFWEPNSHKRTTAMGREIDPADPKAHLRASWIVSGPGITDLDEQIRSSIAARDDQRLDDRTDYDPVELDVPVTDTSDYASTRHAVGTVLEKKNLCPARESDAMRRTVRLFEAYTGSPFDVVDALTSLTRSKRPGDVTIADIESALGVLPASRLLPTLNAPTPGKILKAVLVADGPIGRADILERVGCSGETYRKHADRLSALDILKRVDGRKWTPTVAPWYVPETGATKPGTGRVTVGSTSVDGMLFDALDELGYDLGDPDLIDAFTHPMNRGKLIATIGAWIDDWVDVLASLLKPNPEAAGRYDHDVVTIGEKPDQTSLDDSMHAALAD